MDHKHLLNDSDDALRCKRERVDERREPQPLISDEQRFWTSMAEPPDLNYRPLIEYYMRRKKGLLEDHKMLFQDRCAWIDYIDTIYLEFERIANHHRWILGKVETAREAENTRQKEFWEDLEADMYDEKDNIHHECFKRLRLTTAWV